jgi:small GTP-binding protein
MMLHTLADISNQHRRLDDGPTKRAARKSTASPASTSLDSGSPENLKHDQSEAAALEEQLLYMRKRLNKLRHRSSIPATTRQHETSEETKNGRSTSTATLIATPVKNNASALSFNTLSMGTPKSKLTTIELRAQSAHQLVHLEPMDSKFKILVVGNANCGKTSIVERFVLNTFSEEYKTTVGADFHKKVIDWSSVGDEKIASKVKLHVFDIAGQDRFARLTRSYFNAAKGALVVCDVTREGTFEAAGEWKKEIDRALTTYDDTGKPNKIPVVLVANKCDLLNDVASSFVAGAKMEAACRQHGFAGWFVSSAKSGENVERCMYYLTRQMLAVRDIARAKRIQSKSSPDDNIYSGRNDAYNPYESVAPQKGLRILNSTTNGSVHSPGDLQRLYGSNDDFSTSNGKRKKSCC